MNTIDVTDLEIPIVLRPFRPVTDDELLRFSVENKPYQVYKPNQPVETLQGPEMVAVASPVLGFELRASRLWSKR